MARCLLVLFLVLAISFCVSNLPAEAPAKATPFARFVDEYYDAYFTLRPSEGTAVGLHQYDDALENFSAEAAAARIARLKTFQARLAQIRAGQLTAAEAIDAELLDGAIRAELLDLERLDIIHKNPMAYIGVPAGAIDSLMKRNFAPPAVRLRSVIARLKATPSAYAALRANVNNPPHEFTDLALRMGQGTIAYYRDTVHDWAKDVAGTDSKLLAEFDTANAAVVRALTDTVAWLEKDLLPRSKGSYVLGAGNFADKLRYEEQVDIPLDKLLAIGEANLRRDQEKFVATARKIDPNKTPLEVMHSLSADHPSEADLIPSARRTIEKIWRYVTDHHIIVIPSEVRPTILETPPFARNGSYASMDSPGAFETRATEAFYYVTPPEKDWDAKQKEEHLRLFNAPVMQIITIHEALPGHYIQFLYAKQVPTKTRKLTGCGTNVEGWAHYCEQMMVEEGYGDGDPKIQLAQLSEALLRDCRFVVGIKLHTQGLSVEDGGKFFAVEGFQEPSVGYEEARRGAYNPTYLYYTLGKLQIYKLREDYRKLKGADFRLDSFHSQFVKQGGIPIKLIRRILLPGDSGSTL
jgi:uncharacterized protein (DUF885 family)